ncbi:adenylate kinase [Halopseudomonas pachastrellae]|nr:adenylate kinase [Halopseudomonas pachastrellae]
MNQRSDVFSRKAVCVGGVSGAGKTTMLRTHVECNARDLQITGSSVVKAVIAPATVQELDEWPLARRQEVREQSILELQRILQSCEGHLLVDGHFTLRNRCTGVLESIFTQEDKDFFHALVLIHPDPEAVLAQRLSDDRQRDLESVEQIAEHIAYERREGLRLASEMNVPFLEIAESCAEARLRALEQFLHSLTEPEVA